MGDVSILPPNAAPLGEPKDQTALDSAVVFPITVPKALLLVDDVDERRITTKWFFSNLGYAVDSVRTAEEALALFNPQVHVGVITDNLMLGMSGVEMAHIIKLRSLSTPVLLFTGSMPTDLSCVDAVVLRPSHLMVLKESLDKILAERI